MRIKRLVLIAFVALGLAPGTFWRTIPPPVDFAAPVLIRPLDLEPVRSGPFTLAGAWRLTSANRTFGGYSALMARGPANLLAASDSGGLVLLDLEDGALVGARFRRIAREAKDKRDVDIESLAIDRATGTFWAAYEGRNAIERLDRDLEAEALVAPAAMREWDDNSGAEAFARLPDGRFVAIAEGPADWSGELHRALLFPRDPVTGADPVEFTFRGPSGYHPVGMTALGDGRVLILMRRLDLWFPPQFLGAIMIGDPAEIEPGGEWRARLLARLEPPLPMDNFEGITVTQTADGRRAVWLISDNNYMRNQRTLLLKLRWNERQSPGGNSARPPN